jgi:hypothetical protein
VTSVRESDGHRSSPVSRVGRKEAVEGGHQRLVIELAAPCSHLGAQRAKALIGSFGRRAAVR